jgi:O-antigen/teichoic acid export membrane protein
MLRALQNSASLRASAALALGGVGFTLGNLLLARALSPDQYGLISLVIGVLSLACLAAPLGIDLVVARRGLQLDGRLRRSVVASSVVVGCATAAICAAVYGLPASLTGLILVATAGLGLVQGAAAYFQGQQRFGIAVWLLQISNAVLVPVALITLLAGNASAVLPAALIAAGSLVGGLGSWWLVTAETRALVARGTRLLGLWREALSLLTITMASSTFLQLERLLLVPTVGVQGLALFGVVASLVISPFRMMQSAVQFTLIPGLRAAGGTRERRRLLIREIAVISFALACGSLIIWMVAPPIAHWFLGGRYDLSDALMVAAIVSGALKVLSAFATAVVVSLGDARDLRRLSVTAWMSIAVAVAGAFLAAPWGLVGVLYGISVGWIVRSLAAIALATPYLQYGVGDLPHPVR